mmetsp:Transcript_12752/g.32714  ORF Transcript_12752/g.32714 Transcript_12752/m.32714 type:complete len:271 (-) Transcript_12752:219-1031(-)
MRRRRSSMMRGWGRMGSGGCVHWRWQTRKRSWRASWTGWQPTRIPRRWGRWGPLVRSFSETGRSCREGRNDCGNRGHSTRRWTTWPSGATAACRRCWLGGRTQRKPRCSSSSSSSPRRPCRQQTCGCRHTCWRRPRGRCRAAGRRRVGRHCGRRYFSLALQHCRRRSVTQRWCTARRSSWQAWPRRGTSCSCTCCRSTWRPAPRRRCCPRTARPRGCSPENGPARRRSATRRASGWRTPSCAGAWTAAPARWPPGCWKSPDARPRLLPGG